MRRVAPAILIGIGALHSVIGVIAGWPLITSMVDRGFWNSVETIEDDQLLWFLLAGVLLMFLGHLGLWVEHRLNRALPAFLGWEILALALVAGVATGDLLFPVPLFVAAAVIILIRARRHASPAPRPG